MTDDNIYKCSNNEIEKIINDIKYYSKFYTKKDINNLINHNINNIINTYDINDCIIIIINNGDIYDAINNNDKIKFHQELVRPYVKKWFYNKINDKIIIDENICSICLEDIQPVFLKITNCNHSFHIKCISKWLNNTCPICRNNI